MGAIFISHSEKDLPIVSEIAGSLERAGYRTWYFERDVLPGTSYLIQIAEAVARCDALVLVASSNSVTSDQTTKEVVGAFERRKPFFPILLDLTPPELKESQPEWRHALGGTAMISVSPRGLHDCVNQVVEGLKARGLYPDAGPRGVAPHGPTLQTAVSAPAGKPLPRSLRDKVLSSRRSMEGERKQVTVLFADLSGFTALSEDMDPEHVHDIMEQCLAVMTDEVHRYEGTVAHFLGDGVMAIFGAPIAHEDDPRRALLAALGIRERLRDQARRLRHQGVDLDVHMGVNSGLVMVGRIGEDLTMEYTAMGDTVNLASRMQDSAGPGAIRVTEDTYRLTRGYFDFQDVGLVEVKGRRESIRACELLREGQARTRMGLSATRGLTPFVGRKKELGHLLDCYARISKGRGQVVGIVGEAGVGKSRLVLEMKAAIAMSAEECMVLQGECFHYGESIPYRPLLDILRTHFGLEEGEPEPMARRKVEDRIASLDERLEAFLPPLCDLLSLKVEDEAYLKLEPKDRRERIFEAVRNLLIRESQSQPLVVIVEDLHWMDQTSEEFLDHLIGRLAAARILLVLLYRPQYTHSWGSRTCYSQVSLDEFPSETSLEMVQALFSEGQAATDLRDLVMARSAGNALFMEEFSRTLVERGYVIRRGGQYVLAVDPGRIQVPETIQGIIGARIDALEDDVKQTIQTASVIGREFPIGILQRVLPGETRLADHLRRLQELELVYERGALPEAEYTFKHAMTQEVAYNSLLLKKRKEIHARVGETIEGLYPDRAEEFCEVLARHFSMADEQEKAARYLKLSAEKALRSYSSTEAYRYYRESLKALERLPDTEQNRRARLEIMTPMIPMMLFLSFPEDSVAILKEGGRIAEQVSDRSAAMILYGSIGNAYAFAGNASEALRFNQKAFDEAESQGDDAAIVGIALGLCGSYSTVGDAVRTADVAGRALAALERAGTKPDTGPSFSARAHFLQSLGWARATLGDFDEGERLCDRALESATEKNSDYSLAFAHMHSAEIAMYRGKPEGLLRHAREATRLCEKTELNMILGLGWACQAFAHYLEDDLATARECIEKSISLDREHHAAPWSLARIISGMISLALGQAEEARRSVEQAVELAREHGRKEVEALARVHLGRVMAEADASQAAAAEQEILDGLKTLEDRQYRPWQATAHLLLGETYAIAGQREKALASLEKARQMCREMAMDYYLARAEKALAKLEEP